MTNTVRVFDIVPITTEGVRTRKDVEHLIGELLDIQFVNITTGPPSIESAFDEAIAAPGIVEQAIKVEGQGADAIIIDCMGDPGIDAVREMVKIPVLGPCEVSMKRASEGGRKFSVVTVLLSVAHLFEKNARIYGVADQLASIREIDVPVLEIENRFEEVMMLLGKEALYAV